MANEQILQQLLLQPGQSQAERAATPLRPEHAPIDDRTEADLLDWARTFASHVHFHPADGGPPIGDWTPFFPPHTAARTNGSTPPHLALFIAFLRLYREPQSLLNELTRGHLDFHYRRVLGLAPRPARPDRAHVVIELKKGAPALAVGPSHEFLAGKDPLTGRERTYRPIRDTVIRAARVSDLRSIFVDSSGHGLVRSAPVANSADGLGGELPGNDSSWSGFGHAGLPPAEIGFALASPVLRMKEGSRKISVVMQLSGIAQEGVSTPSLRGAFQVHLTGVKAWLGPFTVSPTLDATGTLTFEVALGPEAGAVVDYDPAVHGYAYTSSAPILQVVLDPTAPGIGYSALSRATIRRARIDVEVSDLTGLGLESDAGALNPRKAFQPFGPEPRAGSRFIVACDEALAKRLTLLEIHLQWKGAPADFATHYSGIATVTNESFTAAVSYADAAGRHGRTLPLFERTQTAESTLMLTGDPRPPAAAPFSGYYVHALARAGARWATKAMSAYVQRYPVYAAYQTTAPEPLPGCITLTLQRDFGHEDYRRKHLTNLMTYARNGGTLTVLREPYTPVVQGISLRYCATTGEVDLTLATAGSFAAPDLHFHHLTAFGPAREHPYQRAQFPWVASQAIPLLHTYEHTGALYIGLRDLQPRDGVSLLLQVAEGSADPDMTPARIDWSVLCDNTWKPLGPEHVTLDTTNHLLRSGLIHFVIPAEATTAHTLLPAGLIWLRATIATDPAAVARLTAVVANALEVELAGSAEESSHLSSGLPPGTITRLRLPLAGIKTINQPCTSFGGAPAEAPATFDSRVAERLRHKSRCITGWDYERIVLEAFPRIHRVKCIPHSRPGCWQAPGHVLLVVVPDLRHTRAPGKLEPRADTDTIARIAEHVAARTTSQATVHVANPSYQRVRFSFGVRFHRGLEFNFHRHRLEERLIEFLSPWAFDAAREPSFGGVIHRSTVLDFIEDLEWVDYLVDFRMQTSRPDGSTIEVAQAGVQTPDAILVSAPTHDIREAS